LTTVLLARHGETDWNRDRRWQGHADPPLNVAGRRQADALARALADTPIEAIYASDLCRAVETAEIVAADRGLTVVADPELREINVGEWSGLTTSQIEARFPAGFARHNEGGDGWEHGESHEEMSKRIAGAVGRIAAAHPEGTVLVVIHGGTIRALLATAAGIDLGEYRRTQLGPVNGSVSRIAVDDGHLRRIDGPWSDSSGARRA
jgi:broad specificity phosphatase PhoE